MKRFIVFAMISAIQLLFLSEAVAQEDTQYVPAKIKKRYWFNLGLGWGGQGGALDFGFSYELKPNRLISLRFSGVATNDHCDEVVVFIPIETPIGKSAGAIDLSYGILRKGRISLFTLSAGPSYVNVETAGGSGVVTPGLPGIYYTTCPADHAVKNEGTVGLALRAQYIPSWRWGGIGISPYININPKYVFGSVTINLALGRMRPRNVSVD